LLLASLFVIPEGDLLLIAVSTRVTMTAMSNDQQPLTVEVETEVGALISQLHQTGWTVSASRYDAKAFGNWYVELRRTNRLIRLSKDRSQYQIDGSNIEEIKNAGLWRAFDDLEDSGGLSATGSSTRTSHLTLAPTQSDPIRYAQEKRPSQVGRPFHTSCV
jgi:hypothetical protein